MLQHQALVLVASLWHAELSEKTKEELIGDEHDALKIELNRGLRHLLLLVVDQLLFGVRAQPVDHSPSCADDWCDLAQKGWDLHLGEPDD